MDDSNRKSAEAILNALDNAVKDKATEPNEIAFHLFHHQAKVLRPYVGEVRGILGLHLSVEVDCGDDGRWPYLVEADHCVDRERFSNLWRAFGGDKLGLTWVDGTKFEIS